MASQTLVGAKLLFAQHSHSQKQCSQPEQQLQHKELLSCEPPPEVAATRAFPSEVAVTCWRQHCGAGTVICSSCQLLWADTWSIGRRGPRKTAGLTLNNACVCACCYCLQTPSTCLLLIPLLALTWAALMPHQQGKCRWHQVNAGTRVPPQQQLVVCMSLMPAAAASATSLSCTLRWQHQA